MITAATQAVGSGPTAISDLVSFSLLRLFLHLKKEKKNFLMNGWTR